jgi:hypothetical protein
VEGGEEVLRPLRELQQGLVILLHLEQLALELLDSVQYTNNRKITYSGPKFLHSDMRD